MTNRRVVITGMGVVSPFGVGVNPLWDNLLAGKSGISKIRKFDTEGYVSQVAGQVPTKEENPEFGFDAKDHINAKDIKKMDTFIQYGLVAGSEAVRDAGLDNLLDENGEIKNSEASEFAERIGVILGSGVGGLPEIERTVNILQEKGPRRVSPFFIPAILPNLLSGHLSIKYGFKGPNSCIVTACATGTHAIGAGFNSIMSGETDVMIAGGAEACICPTAVAGFASAKALTKGYNENPEQACRPFDENRDGFVISEGAGVVVLEEYEHAKARGAKIYAELVGFGQTGDAHHITSPSSDGNGGRRAMELALKRADMQSDEVQYVNAHATSTPAGDKIESQAIQKVFGDKIVVSSTKSMIGHMLGASGAIEAVISVLSLRDQKVAPTINLVTPSEGCDLDYVPNTAREIKLNAVLSNSFGFGGTNASLLFKKL